MIMQPSRSSSKIPAIVLPVMMEKGQVVAQYSGSVMYSRSYRRILLLATRGGPSVVEDIVQIRRAAIATQKQNTRAHGEGAAKVVLYGSVHGTGGSADEQAMAVEKFAAA